MTSPGTVAYATQLAKNAGFSGNALATIVAIAGRESGYGSNEGPNQASGTRGILQFNPGAWAPSIVNASDQGQFNAAFAIYQATGGFGPWTCDTECGYPSGQGVTPTSPETVATQGQGNWVAQNPSFLGQVASALGTDVQSLLQPIGSVTQTPSVPGLSGAETLVGNAASGLGGIVGNAASGLGGAASGLTGSGLASGLESALGTSLQTLGPQITSDLKTVGIWLLGGAVVLIGLLVIAGPNIPGAVAGGIEGGPAGAALGAVSGKGGKGLQAVSGAIGRRRRRSQPKARPAPAPRREPGKAIDLEAHRGERGRAVNQEAIRRYRETHPKREGTNG